MACMEEGARQPSRSGRHTACVTHNIVSWPKARAVVRVRTGQFFLVAPVRPILVLAVVH